ncbi:MAG TPA: hypothetical protein VI895_04650 [Bdellovibrionota bacterium]|nr:hypothetical protein [Bdellovibrionota bacterium]
MQLVLKVLTKMVKDGVIQDYVIGGASALLYFSKPTFTEDIDVFVYTTASPSTLIDLSPIYNYLVKQKKALVQGEHILVEGYPVQFLIPYDDLSREAFEKAITVSLHHSRFKLFDLEYLMAIMIQLGKPKYLERLRILLEDKTFNEKKLLSILSRFRLSRKWDKMKKNLIVNYE